MTVFRDLGLALTGLVAAAASLAGGPCTYQGAKPTVREKGRAINVAKGGMSVCTVADVAHGPRDWTTPYAIELQARERTPAAADQAADLLLAEVFAILAGPGVGAAMSLGVLEVLVTPSIDWDLEEGDTACATATLTAQIVHRTQGNALTPWN